MEAGWLLQGSNGRAGFMELCRIFAVGDDAFVLPVIRPELTFWYAQRLGDEYIGAREAIIFSVEEVAISHLISCERAQSWFYVIRTTGAGRLKLTRERICEANSQCEPAGPYGVCFCLSRATGNGAFLADARNGFCTYHAADAAHLDLGSLSARRAGF